jgi:hypothetical protein
MKKRVLMTGILTCMLVLGTGTVHAQMVTLDAAINNAGDEFSYSLKKGSKVAVLAVRSGSARMSNYIIEEMTSVFMNQMVVTVVDHVQINQLQQEMNFRMSGDVSDPSAQTIGKRLGAQTVITGSFELVGNYYRFRVKAIDVATAAIMATYSANVQNDQIVASLMGQTNTPAPASTVTTAPTSQVYQNFTTGQRWGTWALNWLLPGLGSYIIMKDNVGGTAQVIMGVVGFGLTLGGYIGYYNTIRDGLPEMNVDQGKLNASIAVVTIGSLVFSADGIYNIVRSVTYNKPQPKTASVIDPAAWNIAVLPGRNGIEQVSLSYTMRF